MLVKMLPLMSPETCSNQMPLPPLADLAIGDADVASAEAVHEAAPLRQRNVAAIERDAGEADTAGAFAQEHGSAAAEDEFGRAAHADELRAAREAKHAGAVDAWRQRQRHLRTRGLVDGALEAAGLVVGAAGPHAILRGVAAERGGERRCARRLGRHRQRAGNSGGRGSHEMAAVDVHDRGFPAARREHSGTAEMRRGMVVKLLADVSINVPIAALRWGMVNAARNRTMFGGRVNLAGVRK